VIPPGRALPTPEKSDAALANNPAWPIDPDVKRAKEEAARERNTTVWASDKIRDDERVLRPDELAPGPKPRKSARPTNSNSPQFSSDDPRLSPSELGYKGNFFSKMFGKNDDEEIAKFTGEPPRSTLTAPPPGYQTPSPDQPYGLSARTVAPKATNYSEKHGEGEK